MLALRLPKDIEERLEALAKRTGRSKSYYARQAIIEYIDDLEDVFLVEQAMADDRGERFTLSDIKADLDADELAGTRSAAE